MRNTVTLTVNRPKDVRFELRQEGDTVCLMIDGSYVITFNQKGEARRIRFADMPDSLFKFDAEGRILFNGDNDDD